MLKNKQHMAI